MSTCYISQLINISLNRRLMILILSGSSSVHMSVLILKFCCVLFPMSCQVLSLRCVWFPLIPNVFHLCLIVYLSLLYSNPVFLSSCARLSSLPSEQSSVYSSWVPRVLIIIFVSRLLSLLVPKLRGVARFSKVWGGLFGEGRIATYWDY